MRIYSKKDSRDSISRDYWNRFVIMRHSANIREAKLLCLTT